MSAPKYLKLDPATGLHVEVAGVTTATADSIPSTDANGRLDLSQMPTGVGPELTQVLASESLVAGNWVNFHDVTGVTKARKADATNANKPAHGFVKDNVAIDVLADVYVDGENVAAAASGLVAGVRQFLSTTPGATTATPPSSATNLVQCLGTAVDGTSVIFKPEGGIVVA